MDKLNAEGFTTFGTDIIAPWEQNFFNMPPLSFDAIVTNPPYSIKDKYLARCYELGKPFALLLPVTAFSSGKRQALFNKHGIQTLFMPKRVNFKTPIKQEYLPAWFMTAWFCWGFDLPSQLVFSGHDEEEL